MSYVGGDATGGEVSPVAGTGDLTVANSGVDVEAGAGSDQNSREDKY
jgi:hypothetical protein